MTAIVYDFPAIATALKGDKWFQVAKPELIDADEGTDEAFPVVLYRNGVRVYNCPGKWRLLNVPPIDDDRHDAFGYLVFK